MDKKYEKLLLLKHPMLRPKQDSNIVKDNMEIMAKKMTNEQIDGIKKIEESLDNPGFISREIEKEKNKYDPGIYDKKEIPIWDLMVFGIMTGNGWFPLLDELCSIIEKTDPDIVVEEVKSKYAQLHFYYSSEKYEEIEPILDRAEDISTGICENCGRKGETVGNGWIYTLCDKCIKSRSLDLAIESEQISRELIRKYLLDENFFFTDIDELKLTTKPIINIKGKIINMGNGISIQDQTGSIQIKIKNLENKNHSIFIDGDMIKMYNCEIKDNAIIKYTIIGFEGNGHVQK
jgi:hypothetical protein